MTDVEIERALAHDICELAMSFVEQRLSLVLTGADRQTFAGLYEQHAAGNDSQLAGECLVSPDPSQRVQVVLREWQGQS